ncbi:hypothetical protein CEE39_08505 [bacterium (candidate division B38) B3_B38]|nr:MAG: hypothetical protein CEE39_08505 [bacterium (candidate division B38) B3_B38]
MGLTESEIEQKIDAILSELEQLVTNPQVDYQIGNKRVSASQKQAQLLRQLEYWERKRKGIPTESIDSFAVDINKFGEDKSRY